MTQDEARAIAQTALVWLSEDPERLAGFLAASGAGPGDVRAGAGDPAFLGGLLDHLLGSDATVLAFARDAGLSPEVPARARAALPGGDQPDWT